LKGILAGILEGIEPFHTRRTHLFLAGIEKQMGDVREYLPMITLGNGLRNRYLNIVGKQKVHWTRV